MCVVIVMENVTKIFRAVRNHVEAFKYPGQAAGEAREGREARPRGTRSVFKEHKELLFLCLWG